MKKKPVSYIKLALVVAVVLTGCAAQQGGTSGSASTTTAIADLPKEPLFQRGDHGVARGEEQITGVPGSPSATITLDGKQLPPPPQKFEGKIGLTAQESKPYWPARIVPKAAFATSSIT